MIPKQTHVNYGRSFISVLPASQDRASAIPFSLKMNGHTISNDQAISEHFNKFFRSIGSNLADKLTNLHQIHLPQYLEKHVSSSIYLDVPNLSEIMNAIQALSLNKAIGHDNIPPYYLRIAPSILASYLQIFINFCFTNGVFPETCAIAKIVSIFKKGERENSSNYRLISILTCFSKILEQIIHKRLISFIIKHGIIQHTQYGFQRSVSTNHALVDVVTPSFENIDNNMHTGLIFLDLTTAFDTVNHEVLLHKLDHYGIRCQSNNLLRAFLKRKQYVSINGSNFSLLYNDHGVAQGSTLGPLLILIYINDLPHSVNCIPRLFSDDACLVFLAPTPTQLSSITNKDLDNISQWLNSNKLNVNPSKSDALIIPPKLNKPPPTIDLLLNNSSILISNSAKYCIWA